MKKKSYKDDFEDLYLRHDYLKKAGTLDGTYCEKYQHIIDITSRIMFKKFNRDFSRVGFLEDDLKTISSMYMMAYMELYSIEKNQSQKDRFLKSFKKKYKTEPEETDYAKAESNHIVNFLRQKLQHCAKVCNRKSRNIICGRDRVRYFAYTERSIEVDKQEIFNSCNKYGYRRITVDEYKESLNRAKELSEAQLVDENGFKVIKIENIAKGINYNDYRDIVESEKSETFMDPESRLMLIEEKRETNDYIEMYESLDKKERNKLLKKFIDSNKEDKNYKNQVKLARKLLKDSALVV